MSSKFSHIQVFSIWDSRRDANGKLCRFVRVLSCSGQALASFFHQRDAQKFMTEWCAD